MYCVKSDGSSAYFRWLSRVSVPFQKENDRCRSTVVPGAPLRLWKFWERAMHIKPKLGLSDIRSAGCGKFEWLCVRISNVSDAAGHPWVRQHSVWLWKCWKRALHLKPKLTLFVFEAQVLESSNNYVPVFLMWVSQHINRGPCSSPYGCESAGTCIM